MLLLESENVQPPPEIETPGSVPRARATYWAEFYDRLVQFESRILATMIELSAKLTGDEKKMVEETNIQPLRDLIADFARRRDAWRKAAQ